MYTYTTLEQTAQSLTRMAVTPTGTLLLETLTVTTRQELGAEAAEALIDTYTSESTYTLADETREELARLTGTPGLSGETADANPFFGLDGERLADEHTAMACMRCIEARAQRHGSHGSDPKLSED